MVKSEIGKPRGTLNLKAGKGKFQLSRLAPARDLGFFVAHYWIVNWDLRGQEPHLQENLLILPTDHYLGYPFVLVRLSKVHPEDLRKLIEQAWRSTAPKKLVASTMAKKNAD